MPHFRTHFRLADIWLKMPPAIYLTYLKLGPWHRAPLIPRFPWRIAATPPPIRLPSLRGVIAPNATFPRRILAGPISGWNGRRLYFALSVD